MNLRQSLPALSVAAALFATPVIRAADLFPFVLPWDDASASITNISSWLEKPAGGAGFVEAHGGHLFIGDKRIRFFGVNLSYGANFPTHADAEKIAARMAKFGINCVRFHHMDGGSAPSGLLQKDKLTFDPDSLDRLDYFIAQLKKNGIYAELTLHVDREYPGFKKWEGASGGFKGVDNFFPPFIDAQRDYARTLLTHVNTYTGKAYMAEPAVAFIEINNENSLITEWNNGKFDQMPDPFAAEFQKQWNAWLEQKYGDQTKLAAAWAPGAEPLSSEMLKTDHVAWKLEQRGQTKGTLEFEAGNEPAGESLHINLTQLDAVDGWAQLVQQGIAFAANKTYTVKVRAKSDIPRKISVNLAQGHEPWKTFASYNLSLTTDWQEFHFSSTIPDSEEKGRLSFTNLAKDKGDIWLSGISVRSGGVAAFKGGEKLGNISTFQKQAIGLRTLAAQRDWNEFLVDTETTYWTGMRAFIREDLHAHNLVVGSATSVSPWLVQSKLDVVDAHSFWQNPSYPHKSGDPVDWTVKNVSMAGARDGGTLASLALRRVAGKPFIVSEYNAAAPNTYSSEAFLELCAMAGVQDWDGVFASAYSRRKDDWDTRNISNFLDIDQHPTKMATLPAALALFLRSDIQPPTGQVVAETTPGDALESIRNGGSQVDARTYGIPREEAFRHAIGMRLGTVSQANVPAATGDAAILRTAEGDLVWDTTAHRMLIATSRSAGVVGSVQSGETIDFGYVRIIPGETRQNWATINVTVMDGNDFQRARRILITATGSAENTGMKWKDAAKSSVGTDWGSAPSRVEGISARIELPRIKGAKAWALDAQGQRQTEVPLNRTGAQAHLELSPEQRTLWWEIAVP